MSITITPRLYLPPTSKNLLPLILLLSLPLSTPDWTSDCTTRYPASCRCTWSSGKRLASCEKSNMIQIPTLSSDIQILDMSNNKLNKINDNAFTTSNLINLQKLYLRNSKITHLHALSFNNLRILIEIDLSHNELESVDPNIFSTNVRLRVIKLNNNRIHELREFPVLEYLNSIDLSHNLLHNVTINTFSGLRNLKVLDLSYNSFTNLSPNYLPRLSSLMLRGNNWVCDCELKPLRDYVISYKFLETEVRCSEPLNLFNSQWDSFEDLSCKPEIVNILANGRVVDSIVALETTLILSCVVRGDPLPDVKWVRNGRVVQDVVGDVREGEGVVVMNLTVGKFDNEFVCVGSNSGGVVERNLTVTVDEAGLSGFVVLKDGNGMFNGQDHNGQWRSTGMLVYLVIGVVFLSLVVGLVVGGVCVWRWGKGGENRGIVDSDSVVKGVLKVVGGGGGGGNNRGGERGVGDERLMMMTGGGREGGEQHHQNEDERLFLERGGDGETCGGVQTPLLLPQNPSPKSTKKQHKSADDLLNDPSYIYGHHRPTPDLLVLNTTQHSNDEQDPPFTPQKFPSPDDSTSLYDNYEVYKPIQGGHADTLRRLAMIRGNAVVAKRPSSVCSEPRGSPVFNRFGVVNSPSVVIPHGYVTLPRNRGKGKKIGGVGCQGVIKYDNLGRRTTADGSSHKSLNNIGLDHNSQPIYDQSDYSNVQELAEDDYQQIDYRTLPLLPSQVRYDGDEHVLFEPIIEDVKEEGEVVEPVKKFRPVVPPKPKKKKVFGVSEGEVVGGCARSVDDDGTEV